MKSTLFEIRTENKNWADVEIILGSHFQGYSVGQILGVWKGQVESALSITVANVSRRKVLKAVKEIKELNNQEKVLLLAHEVDFKLV